MKRKRHTSEQVIRKLRLAEAEQASGTPLAEILKKLEVSEATFHRWRNEYGSASPEKVKQLKDLEKENARLRKIVADQQLDIAILREVVIEHPLGSTCEHPKDPVASTYRDPLVSTI